MNATGPLVALSYLVLATALVACGAGSTTSEESSSNDSASLPKLTESASQEGAPVEDDTWGPALEHPERFYGIYADPDRLDRKWFVKKAERPAWAEQAPDVPPGHLALGAMFGDASPWSLKTVSDTKFVQIQWGEPASEPVTAEFEFGDDGVARSLVLSGPQFSQMGRLERQSDLPADW